MITAVKLYEVSCDYCRHHLETNDSEAVFETPEAAYEVATECGWRCIAPDKMVCDVCLNNLTSDN